MVTRNLEDGIQSHDDTTDEYIYYDGNDDYYDYSSSSYVHVDYLHVKFDLSLL